MKFISETVTEVPEGGRLAERAQVRVVLLALISFVLGVGLTATWFHFNPNSNLENLKSQQSQEASDEQPAMPAQVAQPSRPFIQGHPPVDAAAIDDVKQIVPNFASVSLTDGEQMLQDAMLKKFQQTAKDTDAQVKQAEQQISQLQTSGSSEALQAARKHLEDIKTQGTQKLQQIAAQLQTDIAALKQLKGAAQ